MSFSFEVESGKKISLKTAGKYVDRDIDVTATGGAEDLDAVLTEQEQLIETLKDTLQGKAAGGGSDPVLPAGCVRAAFVRFAGDQIVDTGIVPNQDTKINVWYTRDTTAAAYLYGVVSSGNTASVTAYLSSGGAWRFGAKSVSYTPSSGEDIVQSASVSKTGILRAGNTQTISGVADFEAIGSMLIGSARSANGAIGVPSYIGKLLRFEMLSGDTQVLNLTPIYKDGEFGFFDTVNGEFHFSITDTPLEGGFVL